jgi:hypothetical protein
MCCAKCGGDVPKPRASLGYILCMPCGEKYARNVKHTIVPMHKSNYMVVSDRSLLSQLTRPGRGNN